MGESYDMERAIMAVDSTPNSDGELGGVGGGGGEGGDTRQVVLAVVQAASVAFDTEATLQKAEQLITDAARASAQLVVFPEAFIGGYPRGASFGVVVGNRSAQGREEFRRYHSGAIEVPGPVTDRLALVAMKVGIFVVMGVIEREGGTLYCSVVFLDPTKGYVAKHRKLMPTAGERFIWGFGDGSTMPVIDTSVGKIGTAICWENRMPLFRMAMYAKGVEIYCAPTADSRDTWLSTIRHIAMEGGCFVVSSNQFCRRKDYPPAPDYTFVPSGSGGMDLAEPEPEDVVCRGGSAIIAPSGEIIAGPNYEGEAIMTAAIDLGDVVKAKFDFDVVGHYARPDVFQLQVKETPNTAVRFL